MENGEDDFGVGFSEECYLTKGTRTRNEDKDRSITDYGHHYFEPGIEPIAFHRKVIES